MTKCQISLVSWLHANANQDLCDIAGDIAFDALAGYHDARDLPHPVTADECKDLAAEIAFSRRKGWAYAATDPNDPAGEIAKEILAKHGFRVRSGNIGYDATLARNP